MSHQNLLLEILIGLDELETLFAEPHTLDEAREATATMRWYQDMLIQILNDGDTSAKEEVETCYPRLVALFTNTSQDTENARPEPAFGTYPAHHNNDP